LRINQRRTMETVESGEWHALIRNCFKRSSFPQVNQKVVKWICRKKIATEEGERLLHDLPDGLPTVTNCAYHDGGEDRTIPYWAWTVFGVGVATLVFGAVLVILPLPSRRKPGTGGYEMVVYLFLFYNVNFFVS